MAINLAAKPNCPALSPAYKCVLPKGAETPWALTCQKKVSTSAQMYLISHPAVSAREKVSNTPRRVTESNHLISNRYVKIRQLKKNTCNFPYEDKSRRLEIIDWFFFMFSLFSDGIL